MRQRHHGATTLVELLVAFGILGMVMTAVISFYVEAMAVSAKRDEQSSRLRRFHIGLDKMEQMLREGRVASISTSRLTFLYLTDLAEKNGFPHYHHAPVQLVSTEEGVLMIHDLEQKIILPLEAGEKVVFATVAENSPQTPQNTLIAIRLFYDGTEDGRSDLYFSRTIHLERY